MTGEPQPHATTVEEVNYGKVLRGDLDPTDRVRAWVLDAGPSESSSFHVVGSIFDVMYKEGAYTLRPGAGRGGSQALDLEAAQVDRSYM